MVNNILSKIWNHLYVYVAHINCKQIFGKVGKNSYILKPMRIIFWEGGCPPPRMYQLVLMFPSCMGLGLRFLILATVR